MSSMFTLCKDQSLQSLSFDGSRLILPSVSVGNVSQLVVDLFINTLQLPRVGHLHHTSILPLVGSSAYSHTTNTLHTAAEVYHSSELKVTIIQMRTPIAKGCGETFCADLLQWIRSSQFSDVVLLTSTHAHERIDSQIQGSSIRYLLSPCPSLSSLHTHFSQDLHWSPLEPRGKNTTTTAENTTGVLKKSELFIPGSGVSKRLYLKCCSEDVPLVVLLTFSSQGDNIPEALQLATVIDSWLNLRDKSSTLKDKKVWHCPPSWDLMYGGPSPHSLF